MEVCRWPNRYWMTIFGTQSNHCCRRQTPPVSVPGSKAGAASLRPDWDLLRAPHRHSLGISPAGTGLRVRHDLLATTQCVAAPRRVGQAAPVAPRAAARGRQDRLVPRGRGQFVTSRGRGGDKTGPNPTDRRKKGSKHHILTDANGIPLAVRLTGANRHDVTQLIPLVDAIPSVRGKRGHPRRRPKILYADRAYDSHAHRMALWARGIAPQI